MTTSETNHTPPSAGAPPPMGRYATITAVVIGVIVLTAVLWAIRGVLVMVLIGFLLAAGLDPLVKALQRHVGRRGLAVLVMVLGLVVGVALFVVLAIRPAIAQAAHFLASLPELLDRLSSRFGDSSVAEYLASPEFEARLRGAIDDIVAWAAGSVGAVLGFVAGTVGAVFTVFTVAAITVYAMLALPRIKAFAGRAAGDPERVGVVTEVFHRVGGYVTGQLGICAAAGICAGIFFVIIGMPYAALLAIVVAVLDAVPQVGATLGAVVATLVALTESLGTAVAVVIYFIIYQQIENFFIGPRVFASAVSLSPMTVFIAVLVGGTLGGFIGAILALPIAAALKVVIRYIYRAPLAQIESRAVPASLAPETGPPRREARRDGPAE